MDLRGVALPRGRGRKLVAAAAAIALLAGGLLFWDLRYGGPARVQARDERIQVVDGPKDDQKVTLDATFFRPVGRETAPAIMVAHGFGGSKDETRAEAEDLAREGYAVLTWSARGFGRSTGQIALNSPDYEVKDVRQLIDWLAKRPEVVKEGGDPKVGMAGGSYGGAISLMAAAYDRRVDAIAPRITWNDLASVLFPDFRNGGTADSGVFKKLWAGVFFNAGGDGGTACGRFLPSICRMYQEIAEKGGPTREAIETLRRSSPAPVADRIKAPTLLIQGQSDSLFPLDQADANAAAIRKAGTPVSVAWYQGGHDGGDDESDRLRGLVRDWFDRHLKDEPAEEPAPFTVTRAGGLDSATQQAVVSAATAGSYPGLTHRPRTLRLGGGQRTVHNPAGGSPPSVSAVPGLGALSSLGDLASGAAGAAGGLPQDIPGQAATFDSEPLGEPLRLTGAARVRIKVSGDRDAALFAKLYDAGPRGTTPARRLAAPLRVDKAPGGTEVEVTLPAMDYKFDRGHRLRLVLATTDMGFATPAAPATYKISVTSALSVPTVPELHTPAAPLPAWVWALPAAGVAVAAAILLGLRRRRAGAESYDPDSADVPLRIDGLTKTYRGGGLAVDDLSFRVERGQVLGLLGPNGAGKTTTLRMLMGLIHPDAGEIRIFGHRVTPGAPVLARLGSFVEGPGFLPHLSGRDNLDLYWRATGRPAEDSHAEEALKIAGLGAALDRPVRTYSQGMRQRLAIAQAMLGLPDLLVLDEPTNGLDPPQIREMRDVLVKYAEGDRTVIISSHLLAEVEQTCTHAVVMFQGRRVAAGPVTEIIGSQRRLEDAFLEIIGEGS